MKKAAKKVFDSIVAFVMAIVVVFIAVMMIGKSLPAWSATVIVWVGWIFLVLGLLAIVNAVIGLFDKRK